MKKNLAILLCICALISLSACGTSETLPETAEPTSTPKPAETMTLDEYIQIRNDRLTGSDMIYHSSDGTIYYFRPMSSTAIGAFADNLNNWKELTSSFTKQSKIESEAFLNAGFTEPVYCAICNKDNDDDIYFVASNGEVIFDIYNQEAESSIPDEAADMTVGERNALSKAQSYLKSSAFSYTGLIDQLEYSGFSTDEATFAANNCGADWMAQALLKAKSYLGSSALSYSGLIGQLEYSGFTKEEATYGADNCGADWNEQAVLKAESYLKTMSFSREKLIGQLEYSGFTHEQAVYAVDAVYK